MSTLRAGDREFHTLEIGQVLTANAAAASAGVVRQYPQSSSDALQPATVISAGATVAVGPFTGPVVLGVECSAGTVAWSAAVPATGAGLDPTDNAGLQALVSTPEKSANLNALATNPPATYERTVRFKRSALSAAVSNFIATIDLNVPGVQARLLPDGGNVGVRDSSGALLPFHLHRRRSIAYGGAAWSWFSNPRAVYWTNAAGESFTITSYVRGRDAGVTATGAICITRLSHQTNATDEFILNLSTLVLDDHNHAGLWIRPDGRIVACYAGHNQDAILRWRVSTNAVDGDFSQWGTEQTFTASANVTYANPVYLSDSGRLYFFFRLNTAAWAYVVSTDGGLTFGGETSYTRRIGLQIYQVMRATGGNRIDFITTDGHPNVDGATSVNHFTMALEGGVETFRRTDGSAAVGSLPFAPQSAFSTVYAYVLATGNGWLWDVARDNTDAPVCLYQRKNPTNTLAEYWRGRYTAGAWVSEKIADAGMDISTTDEPNYLGGCSFADYDLTRSTVWLVESPGLTNHATHGMWNLFRYTRNAAAAWTVQRTVTADDVVSEAGAVCIGRPVVPRGQPANTKAEVLYFSGAYLKWDNYNAEIQCWPPLVTMARVRVPALSAAIDTTITLRFEPVASAVPSENRALVWQDAHFATMGEGLPGQSLLPDETGGVNVCTTLLSDVDRVKRNDLLGTGVYVDAVTSATAMRLPAAGGLNLASLTGWTLLAEVNPVADGTNPRSIFSNWQGTNLSANVLIRLDTTNTLSALAWNAAGAAMGAALGATTFPAGSWQSLAVTFGATNFTGYRNGTQTGTVASGSAMNAGASVRFSIGASPHNGAHLFKGSMQGVVLMKGEQSAAWVKAWADNRQAYSTLIELGEEARAL